MRTSGDLKAVQDRVDGPRGRPLVVDAHITSFASWVIAHAFAEALGAEDPDRRQDPSAL